MWRALRVILCLICISVGTNAQLRIPSKSKKPAAGPKNTSNAPTILSRGMLRQYEDALLIIEAEDHRVIRIHTSAATKFNKKWADIASTKLKPADQLFIHHAAHQYAHS